MSPSKRERAYAKRRYEKWQAKQQAREVQIRQARRRAALALAAVAAVLVVVGLVMTYRPGADETAATATAEPSAETPSGATSNGGSCQPMPSVAASPMTWSDPPSEDLAEGRDWTLSLQTNCGDITVNLDGAAAPKAVSSTIFLAKNGFWDNTRCHRLTTAGISVLQCGDPTGTGGGGPGYSYGPVENAPADDVYPAGTVAMARQSGKGDSMGSQFFLVYEDSTIPSDTAGGYTIIGTVTEGLDVVRDVAEAGVKGGGTDGAPERDIAITSASVE